MGNLNEYGFERLGGQLDPRRASDGMARRRLPQRERMCHMLPGEAVGGREDEGLMMGCRVSPFSLLLLSHFGHTYLVTPRVLPCQR